MSIINEALKKTEEHLQKKAAADNLIAPKPSGVKPFLLYILILLAGLLLGNFIFSLLSRKLKSNASLPVRQDLISSSQNHKPQGDGLASSSQSHQPQTAQTTNSPFAAVLPSLLPEGKKPPSQASFILNGIFFSNNDGYALINNQIVRVNDYVDGAKVGLITANIVELDNAGQTITLSTRR